MCGKTGQIIGSKCTGQWFVLYLKAGYKRGYSGIPLGTCPAPALGKRLARDLPRSLLT